MNNTMTHIVCANCFAKNRVPTARLGEQPICAKCKSPLVHLAPAVLDGERLAKFIRGNDQIVVVDFWASWCQPCIAMAPQFAQAAINCPNIRFAKLQTDHYEQAAAHYHIRSLPTMVAFQRGQEIDRQSGLMQMQQITHWLQTLQ